MLVPADGRTFHELHKERGHPGLAGVRAGRALVVGRSREQEIARLRPYAREGKMPSFLGSGVDYDKIVILLNSGFHGSARCKRRGQSRLKSGLSLKRTVWDLSRP